MDAPKKPKPGKEEEDRELVAEDSKGKDSDEKFLVDFATAPAAVAGT